MQEMQQVVAEPAPKKLNKQQMIAMGIFALFSFSALAGTDSTFSAMSDMIRDWVEGSLGLGIALAAFAIGLFTGVVKGTVMPALIGVVIAIVCGVLPGIIAGMFTAIV